jgi:hypothetical protein
MLSMRQPATPIAMQSFAETVRLIARVALMLCCVAIALTLAFGVRFIVFEYFHGDADVMRHLADQLWR